MRPSDQGGVEMRVIKAGAFVLMTCGEYSDYYVRALFRAKQDLDIDKLADQYLAKYPKQSDEFKFSHEKFDAWLVKSGFVEEVDCFEWDTGQYRTIHQRLSELGKPSNEDDE
jgi:hypothetical protein